jgi:hypothetical protein
MRKKLLLLQKTTTLATTTAMMTILHLLLTLRVVLTTLRLTNSRLHQQHLAASHNIPTMASTTFMMPPSSHITLKIMWANSLQHQFMTHMVTRQGQVTM